MAKAHKQSGSAQGWLVKVKNWAVSVATRESGTSRMSRRASLARLDHVRATYAELKLKEAQERLHYIYGIQATYDAAQTTQDNAQHWAAADALSADGANNPDVRYRLRVRSRYEVANNSYAQGIVLTLANHCIGSGPRLQLLGGEEKRNRDLEASFHAWATEVHLGRKLRTMRTARATDGETFAQMVTNEGLSHEVKLDLQLLGAEMVATPQAGVGEEGVEPDVDGIVLDEFGNPETYYVLDEHPGDAARFSVSGHPVKATEMIHWFRAERPGQHRGVPEIMPGLPLFAQLRRWTLAELDAAEAAARPTLVLQGMASANVDETVKPLDEIELQRNWMTAMPLGYELGQVKSEHPATTYEMFKRELLNEIARCVHMPYNIAACNSSGYNYSSGRLDHQTYFVSVRIDQSECEEMALDPILRAWLSEKDGRMTKAELPAHQWFWDAPEPVDETKRAEADETDLRSGAATYARVYGRKGLDYMVEMEQRVKEAEFLRSKGLPVPGEQTAPKLLPVGQEEPGAEGVSDAEVGDGADGAEGAVDE